MVDKVALGQMFSPSISTFLRQYNFTSALYSLNLISLTQHDISAVKVIK